MTVPRVTPPTPPTARAAPRSRVWTKAVFPECPWLREFSAPIHKPGAEGESIPWDWLPADWTAEPRFFDRDAWLEAEPMRAGNVAEQYRWVTGSLDELLAAHGYRREGEIYRAERPSTDTVVLFCHFGVECVLLSRMLNLSPMVLWHGFCAAPSSVTTLVTEERREGEDARLLVYAAEKGAISRSEAMSILGLSKVAAYERLRQLTADYERLTESEGGAL